MEEWIVTVMLLVLWPIARIPRNQELEEFHARQSHITTDGDVAVYH